MQIFRSLVSMRKNLIHWLASGQLVLIITVATSCHSYKSMLNDQQVSDKTLRENIIPGKKYEVTTKERMKMVIRVDSLFEDRMVGSTRLLVNGLTRHKKNYPIYFEQVESVRDQKISTGKTIAVILVPIGLFVAVISTLDHAYGSPDL